MIIDPFEEFKKIKATTQTSPTLGTQKTTPLPGGFTSFIRVIQQDEKFDVTICFTNYGNYGPWNLEAWVEETDYLRPLNKYGNIPIGEEEIELTTVAVEFPYLGSGQKYPDLWGNSSVIGQVKMLAKKQINLYLLVAGSMQEILKMNYNAWISPSVFYSFKGEKMLSI